MQQDLHTINAFFSWMVSPNHNKILIAWCCIKDSWALIPLGPLAGCRMSISKNTKQVASKSGFFEMFFDLRCFLLCRWFCLEFWVFLKKLQYFPSRIICNISNSIKVFSHINHSHSLISSYYYYLGQFLLFLFQFCLYLEFMAKVLSYYDLKAWFFHP